MKMKWREEENLKNLQRNHKGAGIEETQRQKAVKGM